MNCCQLIGRLTADPVMRETQDGTQIANYTLAVDRFNGKDADFIRCIAFNKGAQFAEKYLHKGSKIAVTGRIQTGSYTDKVTGAKVYTTDVVVNTHDFCESKGDQPQAAPDPVPADGKFHDIPADMDEELPFV